MSARRRRRLLILGAVPAFLLLVWLGTGLWHAAYVPERSSRYIWGAYHVHSSLSDGLGSLDEIAAAARRAGTGFVILADHGAPNREAALRRERLDGVILYGGSEAGLPEGHLMAFGQTRLPLCKFPSFPPEAVADVHDWGGLAVVAYPVEGPPVWRYWESDFRPDGIELLNLVSEFRRRGAAGQIGSALMYPFTPYALLPSLAPPDATRARWEELQRRGGAVAGYFATNAHGGVRLGGRIPLPFPSYEATFRLVALGVDRAHAADPLAAVRAGDFFSIVRGAGEPQEFQFHAEREGRRYLPGSVLTGPASICTTVKTESLRTRWVLLRDGRPIRESTGPELVLHDAADGVYRVEAYLPDHPLLDAGMPWIVSNPIRIGRPAPAPIPEPGWPPRERRPVELDGFAVERDDRSSASFARTEGQGIFAYTLSRHEDGGANRWCALARRRPLDLRGMEGFYILPETSDTLRYFVELRAGERWFYASFRVDPGSDRPVRVPFTRFYRVNGGRGPMPLGEIDSLFLSVSNYNSATGFSARLAIRELGFYRH